MIALPRDEAWTGITPIQRPMAVVKVPLALAFNSFQTSARYGVVLGSLLGHELVIVRLEQRILRVDVGLGLHGGEDQHGRG